MKKRIIIVMSVVLVCSTLYIFRKYTSEDSVWFSATTQTVASCGNSIVEWIEECDGHNRANGIYCNEDCTLMLLP
jgi:cysteine-rich repeat protein